MTNQKTANKRGILFMNFSPVILNYYNVLSMTGEAKHGKG